MVISEPRAEVRERLSAVGLTTTRTEDPDDVVEGPVDHVLDCVGPALPVEVLSRLASRVVPGGTLGLVGARTAPTQEPVGDLLATVWRRGLNLHAGITPARRYLVPALSWLADHGSELAASVRGHGILLVGGQQTSPLADTKPPGDGQRISPPLSVSPRLKPPSPGWSPGATTNQVRSDEHLA